MIVLSAVRVAWLHVKRRFAGSSWLLLIHLVGTARKMAFPSDNAFAIAQKRHLLTLVTRCIRRLLRKFITGSFANDVTAYIEQRHQCYAGGLQHAY